MHGAKHALFALALLAAAFSPACRGPKYPEGLFAEITTNKGLIVLQLEFEKTPMTAANFVGLAEGTIENAAFPPGRPYFDGTKWHRVVPGHVIQCGIAAGGKAEDPGYEFPNEIVLPELNHGRAGMVNMANGGPHTNASQWCITLGDRSYLDGDYTVFGHVAEGLDVVMAVVQGDAVRTVKIVRVGRKARAFKPTTESFKAMVDAARVRVVRDDAAKRARETELVRTEWPNAIDAGNGVKYVVLKPGQGQAPVAGARVKVAYSGKAPLAGKSFVSTADEGQPYWGETPEKRLVIVPSEQGYKTSGLYAKQRPGEKRFVISPDTLLVYEIEVLDILPSKK
jgi:cyclophilin family peptidyl-prolyl cis-trans isomerase